ncbi:Ras-related protein Rab-3C [Galemys pyrenaicus]|uniref:small monomeric GTPase n=1 Tax=Galemys pyrenaicus TaxID=202257 RepID=A0A8J6A8W8_GALPY|nr:Ras-related protein Rab-3C [Galemys pyrenaicus]
MASTQDARFGQKDSSDQNFDYMFKLLIIGNSSVGKTSFLFRYADDSFTSAFVSTVGIDFKVKTVFKNEKRIKLQIWDSALLMTSNRPYVQDGVFLPLLTWSTQQPDFRSGSNSQRQQKTQQEVFLEQPGCPSTAPDKQYARQQLQWLNDLTNGHTQAAQ